MSWNACKTRFPKPWIVFWSVIWLSGMSGCCYHGGLPRHSLVSSVPHSLTTETSPFRRDGQSFRTKGCPAGQLVAGRSHRGSSRLTGVTPVPVPAHSAVEQSSLEFAAAHGHQVIPEAEDHSVLSSDPAGREQVSLLAVPAECKQPGKPLSGSAGGGDSTNSPGEEIDVFGDSTVKFRLHPMEAAGENLTSASVPGTTSISNRPASIAVFSAQEALRDWSPHASHSQQRF